MTKIKRTTKDGIIIKSEHRPDGTIRLDLSCEDCGEEISMSDPDFGFDCKNQCAKNKERDLIPSLFLHRDPPPWAYKTGLLW